MRNPRTFRSSYACEKYHQGICSLLIHSVVSNDSVMDSEGPDQTMSNDTFPHSTAQIVCPYHGSELFLCSLRIQSRDSLTCIKKKCECQKKKNNNNKSSLFEGDSQR